MRTLFMTIQMQKLDGSETCLVFLNLQILCCASTNFSAVQINRVKVRIKIIRLEKEALQHVTPKLYPSFVIQGSCSTLSVNHERQIICHWPSSLIIDIEMYCYCSPIWFSNKTHYIFLPIVVCKILYIYTGQEIKFVERMQYLDKHFKTFNHSNIQNIRKYSTTNRGIDIRYHIRFLSYPFIARECKICQMIW